VIAEHDIPYTQLESDAWDEFIHSLNPDFHIPPREELRDLFIVYAQELLQEGIMDLRGEICGMSIDGAKILDWHCYVFVLVHNSKLRLGGLEAVSVQTSAVLADCIHKVYREISFYTVTISGICTDNAHNLVAAITKKDPEFLIAQLGKSIPRVACGAHTGQLAIQDVGRMIHGMPKMIQSIKGLMSWLESYHQKFKEEVKKKMPHMLSTRWNTLCDCLKFLLEHKAEIDAFIVPRYDAEMALHQKAVDAQKKNPNKPVPEEIQLPPEKTIPDDWIPYLETLTVFQVFTDRIEGDLFFQQHLFLAFRKAMQTFEDLIKSGNPTAVGMKFAFETRFYKTADILLSQLSYTFTPQGLAEVRSLALDGRSTTALHLKQRYQSFVLEVLGKEDFEKSFSGALFNYYINILTFTVDESPSYFWKSLMFQSVVISDCNDNKPITLRSFCRLALSLITLPASEAMTERCFSTIKCIESHKNQSIKQDLYFALATIKIALRYKRKNPLQRK
jgi:hypothetical protein